MLLIGTAMFGIFFFLTIFVQTVLGYSALMSGLAFLPFAGMMVVVSGIVGRIIARTGARPLMLAGTAITAAGMFWFSRVNADTSYVGGLLGPSLVTATGLGLLFVPLTLVALNQVRHEDSGLASSLLSTGQQLGGAIGLAVLGTIAWSQVASSLRGQTAPARASAYQSALASGLSHGFLAASGIVLGALVITAIAIRARPAEPTSPAAAAQEQPASTDRAAEPSRT